MTTKMRNVHKKIQKFIKINNISGYSSGKVGGNKE